MRVEYKLVKSDSYQKFDRRAAIEHYKKIKAINKAVALYVSTLRRHTTGIRLDEGRYAVKQLREKYNAQINKQNTRYALERVYLGRIIRVSVDTDEIGRAYLKDALDEIKHNIRRSRADAKYIEDRLKQRPIGYYLKKYQDRVFKQPKFPKTDAEFTGIEIECVMPSNADMSKLLPFAKWVNVGTDGSIHCDEDNEVGQEIRVCIERSEVRNVIPNLLQTLQEMGAYVNKSCGLHVHLDRRNDLTPDLTFQKLVRSLHLLYTVVPKSRRSNTYCSRNRHADWNQAKNGDRYKAINATSYSKYRTIEVRLFGGTLEGAKVVNWIETLWAIAKGEMVTRCPKSFDTARRYWNLSDENLAWLKARQDKFADLNAIPTEETEPVREEERVYCEHCDVYDEHYTEECDPELSEVA